MAQVLIGREIPNLKITLGNDVQLNVENYEEGEISEPETILHTENTENKSTPNQNVEVIRTWFEPLHSSKVYENKGGAFITGLDLSSESLIKKLEERAARFGLEKRSKNKITQEEIDALYKSLDIDLENMKNSTSKARNIRLDALHMRGVDDMNTNQIFSYFNEYGPSSVEWINDSSCNVVWLDETSTARALLGMSHALVVRKKGEGEKEMAQTVDDTGSLDNETGIIESSSYSEVILMSEDSNDNDETNSMENAKTDTNYSTPMVIDAPFEKESTENKLDDEDDPLSVDVPVPPGHWRLGIPHPKAKAILLRFSTKDDKKLPGAEKRSHYYQKYGNPNYGGLKGLISTSRKRKIQATRTRQVVERLTDEPKTYNLHINTGNISGDEADTVFMKHKQNRSKQVRMRMYADDEEEKREKKPPTKRFRCDESAPKQRSVHDRLGKKYTTDDLWQLGSRSISSDDDRETEPPKSPITRKVSSRYNIWTTLAESMAEEDIVATRTYQPKKRTGDLRDTLSSSVSFAKRQSNEGKKSEDLRSKIKRIRKDDNISKHKSPLLLPDSDSSSSD